MRGKWGGSYSAESAGVFMTMSSLISRSPNSGAMLTSLIVLVKRPDMTRDIWTGNVSEVARSSTREDPTENVCTPESARGDVRTQLSAQWSLKDALNSIERIRVLKDNWDNEGSGAFAPQVLDRVSEIVKLLDPVPYVAPTGWNSILLEHYGEGKEYLSFDICDDDSVQMLRSCASQEYMTRTIPVSDIPSVVNEFYG